MNLEGPEFARALQLMLAPVVLISAAGLLGLAFYNRLAAIVSRTRAFNKERFDVLTRLSTLAETAPGLLHEQLAERYHTLQTQEVMIIKRARRMRNALICLLSSVFCMLCCVILLGLSLLTNLTGWLPLTAAVCFGLGLLALLSAVVCALLELFPSLAPVLLEKEKLDERMSKTGSWRGHV